MKNKLSVVLATYNEEDNIKDLILSVKEVADEIVVVDGSSIDKTREIARAFGARVIKTKNYPIFHVNKQKALKAAKNKWVLQLDADERVSQKLGQEILQLINMTDKEIDEYEEHLTQRKLFLRHQSLIEKRDGAVGTSSPSYAAFFVPRRNYFLGKFLKYGGTYPDGVIRLVQKDKANFPQKSVHEQIKIDGKIGWLQNDLLHIDSPNFARYLVKNSRYIDLIKDEMEKEKVKKNPVGFIRYFFIKPLIWFFLTTVRYKGILDGIEGIVFSFFSSLRFPRAYWRYLQSDK